MATSVLDKTMRKIEKAFAEYQTAIETMGDAPIMPNDYDPEKFFIEQPREIVRSSLIDATETALRQTMADLRESLADLQDLRSSK